MEMRCLGCMKLKESRPVCEHCGYDENSRNNTHQLPAGTVVGGQYLLGRVLGQGGFGITYIGWDQIMNQTVAVKEYFPSGYAGRDSNSHRVTSYDNRSSHDFEHNKRRFLREAESLAKLWDIPQIVKVLRHFEDNGTAYIAMEYVEGMDLRNYMKQLGRPLTVTETLNILGPVMEALTHVHRAELVHRDISPDNIMVLPDGSTKLLDFGAARYVENANAEADRNTSTQAILKHGFAPPEQYQTHGALGPWTDVYAMCATIYFCLTGRIPTEAMTRFADGDGFSWDSIPGLSELQKSALENGMHLQAKYRIASMEELRQYLIPEEEIQSEISDPEDNQPDIPKSIERKQHFLGIAAGILAAVVTVVAVVAVIGLSGSHADQMPVTAAPSAAATVPVSTLTLPEAHILSDVSIGETFPMPILSDQDPANIQWHSSNPSAASISKNGILTVAGFGDTEILAQYRGQKATCIVRVELASNVTCTYESGTITGYEGTLPDDVILPNRIYENYLTAIGNYAFTDCSGLRSVIIPPSVTSIGWYAFSGCTSLTDITVPSSVTSIGYRAFHDCKNLTRISIPHDCTVGTDAFPEWCRVTYY